MAIVAQHLGERIRELRAQRGWRQGDLAERAGVSSQTVSNIETDRFKPATRTLEKLAAALGVSMAELWR